MQHTIGYTQVQKFIDSLLTFEVNTPVMERRRSQLELTAAINAILTARQYISQRPNEQLKAKLLEKIASSVIDGEPIHLIIATGGFKNYHSVTWPHIDWAEVFALKLLLDMALRINVIYQPGIILEFTGDSYAVSFCNNIPTSAIDTYIADFDELLRIYQTRLPRGIKLVHRKLETFYSLDELSNRMKERADRPLDNATLEEYENQFLKKATNNFMLRGTEDHSKLTKDALKPHLMRSILLDRAWMDIDTADRIEYLEGGNRIPIIHTSSPGSIMLKSVTTRKLAFWLGTGLLRIDGERIVPDIVHASKFSAISELNEMSVVSPLNTISSLRSIPHTVESWLV
jgi:hypothetical protein